MTGTSVLFGDPAADHARVTVWSRGYPGGQSVFDDNWLNTEIVVRAAPAVRWRYHAFLRAGDFATLRDQLTGLLAGDRDRARLDPRDPWIAAEFAFADAPDAVDWLLRLRDGGSERGLRLRGTCDRARVAELLRQTDAVVTAYPILARR